MIKFYPLCSFFFRGYIASIISLLVASPTCTSAGRGTLAYFGGVPTTWTTYYYNYTATATVHTIMFGFTADGSGKRMWFLDDVSIVDIVAPTVQLLQNPSFDNSTTALTGWTQYCTSTCPSGSANGGQVATGINCTSTNCYMDRCYGGGAFDLLSQTFPTIIGHNYSISFDILDFGSGANGGTKAYVDMY